MGHCDIISTEKEMGEVEWGVHASFKSPECSAVLPDQSFKYSPTSAAQQMCQ